MLRFKSSIVRLRAYAARIASVVVLAVALGGAGASVAFVGFGAAVMTATPAKAAPRAVRRACRSDYKTLCPRYRAGTSRMRNCMRANGSQLSWRCYEALRDYGYVDGRRRGRRRR